MATVEKPRILIVDDDPGHLETLSLLVAGWGYEVRGADSGEAALAAIREQPRDAVLMDVRMAGMGGLEALEAIKAYNPATPVLIMTAYSSVDTAVRALKAGAYDYLTKPLDFDVLQLTLERALDHVRLRVENQALRRQLPPDFAIPDIIGRGKAMRDLLEMTATVAPTEATVLITGESGTGKELVAKALHANSPRRKAPLVAVNCAALTETLLESELFGHEKGAFTGADKARDGHFAQANKGTIFLDEIGEIPPTTQAKLLRVIQEREVRRVGGDKPFQVDVRILAATNRDLAAEVVAGRFREDLFYRLNVVTLVVPPLRERPEDIPLLAQHFTEHFATKNRKQVRGFTPQAMDLLVRHPWPGNVRELENAVERAVIMATSEYVTERELPLSVTGRDRFTEANGAGQTADASSPASLEEIERRAIVSALERAGGNKSEAARVLGISRVTLHKKLKQWGME